MVVLHVNIEYDGDFGVARVLALEVGIADEGARVAGAGVRGVGGLQVRHLAPRRGNHVEALRGDVLEDVPGEHGLDYFFAYDGDVDFGEEVYHREVGLAEGEGAAGGFGCGAGTAAFVPPPVLFEVVDFGEVEDMILFS